MKAQTQGLSLSPEGCVPTAHRVGQASPLIRSVRQAGLHSDLCRPGLFFFNVKNRFILIQKDFEIHLKHRVFEEFMGGKMCNMTKLSMDFTFFF